MKHSIPPSTEPSQISASVSTDLRRPALIALAVLVVAAALLSGANVLRNPFHTDASIYGFACFSYFAAGLSQLILLPRHSRTGLRVRWCLWVAFLFIHAGALFFAFVYGKHLGNPPAAVKNAFYAVAYALAYIVTVNPPRSSAWRRLWLVDAAIAAVMGIMFFLVYLHGEQPGIYTALLFVVALQALFATGSLLSLRTADTPEGRDLARYMLVFFLVRMVLAAMANLPRVWPMLHGATAADVLYTFEVIALSGMPLLPKRVSPGHPSKSKSLPPAAPVLITGAILLACLPLLHYNFGTGVTLLVLAVALFALKVALLQSDFDHERTSLLQSNRQLRELAYTDPVTGVANRRRFVDSAQNALLVARCGFGPASLILFELDDFDSITAASGRHAGEVHLRDFAATVQATLQPINTNFARIATGEFALLLEQTSRQGAEQATERLRAALKPSSLRFSSGAVSAASAGPVSVERWLAEADNDLRRSKRDRLSPPQPGNAP